MNKFTVLIAIFCFILVQNCSDGKTLGLVSHDSLEDHVNVDSENNDDGFEKPDQTTDTYNESDTKVDQPEDSFQDDTEKDDTNQIDSAIDTGRIAGDSTSSGAGLLDIQCK